MSTGWMCAEGEEGSHHHLNFSCDHRELPGPQAPCSAESERWVCKYPRVPWQAGSQGLQAGAEGTHTSRNGEATFFSATYVICNPFPGSLAHCLKPS